MARRTSGNSYEPRTDVSASEVANYVFCAKAWHLEQMLGRAASADAKQRREEGAVAHAAHGASIRTGSARIHARLERVLVAVLLVALLLFLYGLAVLLR